MSFRKVKEKQKIYIAPSKTPKLDLLQNLLKNTNIKAKAIGPKILKYIAPKFQLTKLKDIIQNNELIENK